jgi:hypothetical protein
VTAVACGASSTREETWQLYVDETGEFDGSDVEKSFVVGLLIRGPASPSAVAEWKRAVQESFPFSPWPPHMAELNLRSFRPYRIARQSRESPPRAVPEVLRQAVDCLRRYEPFERILAEAPPDRCTLRAVLQASDAWLQSYDHDLATRLDRHANAERDRAVQRLRQGLEACADAALLVIAAARPTTRALPTSMGASSHDPYYDALETLLHQVMASVGAMDGAECASVWAEVAARDLSLNPSTGTKGRGQPVLRGRSGVGAPPTPPLRTKRAERRPLTSGDLQLCLQRLHARGRVPRLRPVVFRFAQPPKYHDARVHPGIVAADVLANGVRHVFCASVEATTPLARVIDWLNGTLKVPPHAVTPRLGADRLPSIGAAGVARQYVEAHWRGTQPTVSLEVETALWAREAAGAWAAALTSARRSA